MIGTEDLKSESECWFLHATCHLAQMPHSTERGGDLTTLGARGWTHRTLEEVHDGVEAGLGVELGVEGVAEVGEAHQGVGGAADGWSLLVFSGVIGIQTDFFEDEIVSQGQFQFYATLSFVSLSCKHCWCSSCILQQVCIDSSC